MHRAALILLLALFAFLHAYRAGELSFTWDEGGDLWIVHCLQEQGNPFVCLEDISQTRLPFYLHALVGSVKPGSAAPHLALSFLFSLVTMACVYAYTRREFGALAATLFVALYVTAPQLLAGGRMVLTHSAIIFTCFTTLSILAMLEHCKRGAGFSDGDGGRAEARATWLAASAVLTGLAGASSVLAGFNGIFLLAIYLTRCRKSWRDLMFVPIALATFFATTVIYLSPPLFRQLLDALRAGGGKYPFWNYLGLGTNEAPWFFPFLLLAIKVGPWLVFAFHRAARWFLAALAINLMLKGVVFGYETPHHQMQFYPLLYMFIAAGIARWRRPWVIAIAAVLFAVQLREVVRFFPNYLFHGAQYGERFIGEFYGPAVIHAQGRERIWEVLEALAQREPEAKILVADHNAFDVLGERYVKFGERDPNARYKYALVDRLYATHFEFPEQEAYNAFLARHYKVAFETKFPPGIWVYRIMERKSGPEPLGTGAAGRAGELHDAQTPPDPSPRERR